MEIHVTATEAARGEGRVHELMAARRFVVAPSDRRREICCRGCGYGAVVAHPLSRCPMCGGDDWRRVRAEVSDHL